MAKYSRFIKEIQRMERKEPWRRKSVRNPTRRTPEPEPTSEEDTSTSSKEEEKEDLGHPDSR